MKPSDHSMPTPDQAYCSTISGTLGLLIQLAVGLNVAAVYLTGVTINTDFDRDSRYRLYAVFFWCRAVHLFMAASCLVELLTVAGLLLTRLRCSLYLTRIKIFRCVGLVVAAVVVFVISQADFIVARRNSVARGYQYDDSPFSGYAAKFAIASLLINLSTLLAMVLGGGIDALTMEAKTAWKTLYIAELIGLQQEWAVTDVELQGSGAEHGSEIGSPRIRFDDDGAKTPPTPQAKSGDL